MPEANKVKYRLGLDLGTNSIGWAVLRLDDENKPTAIIRAGVRIFSDGREAKTKTSLAVNRREKRSQRRRRDRYLMRRNTLIKTLIDLGFFPKDTDERKGLVSNDPYEIRNRALTEAVSPAEFARALYHINQRRGFKSNRKTEAREEPKQGSIKFATRELAEELESNEDIKTIGQWLYKRKIENKPVRIKPTNSDLNSPKYDVYISRAMMEDEFNQIWDAQYNFWSIKDKEIANLFSNNNKEKIFEIFFYQRPLKPVEVGRCTFFPDLKRAPKALPIFQKFRILSDLNKIKILTEDGEYRAITLDQRNKILEELLKGKDKTFDQIRKLLGLSEYCKFNIENSPTGKLLGDKTTNRLSKKDAFSNDWFKFSDDEKRSIVQLILDAEDEEIFTKDLSNLVQIDPERIQKIYDCVLPDGYGHLSEQALVQITKELESDIIQYDEAVRRSGIEHHSKFNPNSEHENLPYYGKILERQIGTGTRIDGDSLEKYYGKVPNPTVHIVLNQLRLIVNNLIGEYGKPSQIVLEMARDLKNSKEKRDKIARKQSLNSKNNERIKSEISNLLQIPAEQVKKSDIVKFKLWEELSENPLERCCPYSGKPIGIKQLFTPEVDIEHIIPYSLSLDDSNSNKTVAFRLANQYKGNNIPYSAFSTEDAKNRGYDYDAILARTRSLPESKRYRFTKEAKEIWEDTDKDFLGRALNDTRYMSKLALEYIKSVCNNVWVIPGQLTARFRHELGLKSIISEIKGFPNDYDNFDKKNRNDHRHHAIDACVIAITDRNLLQKYSRLNAKRNSFSKLESVPKPWETFRDHVLRAVSNIIVSHKPNHGYQGQMHEETAHNPNSNPKFIKISSTNDPERHGVDEEGNPLPYKAYDSGNNYCVEIFENEDGSWGGEVITRYRAYQIIKESHKELSSKENQGKIAEKDLVNSQLRNPYRAQNGKPLVMRLMANDMVKMDYVPRGGVSNGFKVYRLYKMAVGEKPRLWFSEHCESNVAERVNADNPVIKLKEIMITANSLAKHKCFLVNVGPTGKINK